MSKDKPLSKEELYKKFQSAGFHVSYRDKTIEIPSEAPTIVKEPVVEEIPSKPKIPTTVPAPKGEKETKRKKEVPAPNKKPKKEDRPRRSYARITEALARLVNVPVTGICGAADATPDARIPCRNLLRLPAGEFILVLGTTNLEQDKFYVNENEYRRLIVPSIVRDLNLDGQISYSINDYEEMRLTGKKKELKPAATNVQPASAAKQQTKQTTQKAVVREMKPAPIPKPQTQPSALKPYAPQTSVKSIVYDQLPLIVKASKCPVCDFALQQNVAARVVTWRDDRKTGSREIAACYCNTCELPFIEETAFFQERKRLSPSYFRVIEIKHKVTRDKLADRIGAPHRKVDTSSVQPADKPKQLAGSQSNGPAATPDNLSKLPSSQYIEIYAKKCVCTKCGQFYSNNMESCTAMVDTVSGKTAKVTVMHCTICGKYYMNYDTFKQYSKMYGGLLCEIKLEASLWAEARTWSGFAPDSVLSRCGYTVKAGTSVDYRHRVLTYVIDSGRASKAEVIQLITGFTKTHKTNHPEACKRWQEDIQFVNNYRQNAQRTVTGLQFKQKGKLRR